MQPHASAAQSGLATASLCRNCNTRPADTPVSYEEILFAETRATKVSFRRSVYRNRFITRYGKTTLCAACATAYRRNVALRANGRRLTYVGFGIMLAAGLVYLFLSGDMQTSAPGLIVAAFVGLGALGLLAGIGMNLAGRAMRKTAAAFVGALK